MMTLFTYSRGNWGQGNLNWAGRIFCLLQSLKLFLSIYALWVIMHFKIHFALRSPMSLAFWMPAQTPLLNVCLTKLEMNDM